MKSFRPLLLLAALSCGDPGAPAKPLLPVDPAAARGPDAEDGRVGVRAIVSLVLSPNPVNVNVGATATVSVAATSHTGAVFTNPAAATWTTSNAGVATVSSLGVVTGVSVGTATVRAAAVNGVYGETTVNVSNGPPPPATQTLLAAGDIAMCTGTFDEATANVLDAQAGTIAALGDLAYPSGTATDFSTCYDPTWGRHKSRTRPAAGNHEYSTSNPTAAPYYAYFGSAAGNPSQGYYSYDLGAWHIVVLNSNCSVVACAAGSAQETWLRADLAATTQPCILAYWHHPRFTSSSRYSNDASVAPFWAALYQYGADIVLNGHAHQYERFGLQNPSQQADANGIRQFTIGTGGRSPQDGFRSTIQPNSQRRATGIYGVMKFTLGNGTYAWNFLPIAGQSFTENGSGTCH